MPITPLQPKFNIGGSGQKEKAGQSAGIFDKLSLGGRSAQKRADQSRRELMVAEEQRRAAEEEQIRAKELQDKLKKMGSGPQSPAANHPNTIGWGTMINRVAKEEGDVETALRIADIAQNSAQKHNEAVLGLIQDRDSHEARRGKNAARLENSPLTVARAIPDWSKKSKTLQSKEGDGLVAKGIKALGRGGLQVVSGACNLLVTSTLATLNLTPADSANEIQVGSAGLHMSSPFSRQSSVDFRPEDERNLLITYDPAKWLDPLVGLLKRFNPNSNWAPLGRVVVIDRPSGEVVGSAVAINPAKKATEIKKLLRSLVPYPLAEYEIPSAIPEPSSADLLGSANQAINPPPVEEGRRANNLFRQRQAKRRNG